MSRTSALDGALSRELAEARFARLYRDYGREILGYAVRRCADREDAADILAETFSVAWRRLGDVPPDESARVWLYATARRLLANQRRGEQRRNRLADRLREELRRGISMQAPAEIGGVMAGALATLGAEDRELLTLIAWEELSPSEAAQVLGISPLAARTRLHRARRRLQERLVREGCSEPKNEIEIGEAR